jgi:hypothetical protein
MVETGRPFTGLADLTPEVFVEQHVKAHTYHAKAPLYAFVPDAFRGTPSVFISHTWASPLLDWGYGTVEAVGLRTPSNPYVWMDVICHNQHNVGDVSSLMLKVMSDVDTLVLPMSSKPFYHRIWCLWELLCAQKLGKKIIFLPYAKHDFIDAERHDQFFASFRSVRAASATKKEDHAAIMHAINQQFGSSRNADVFLRKLFHEAAVEGQKIFALQGAKDVEEWAAWSRRKVARFRRHRKFDLLLLAPLLVLTATVGLVKGTFVEGVSAVYEQFVQAELFFQQTLFKSIGAQDLSRAAQDAILLYICSCIVYFRSLRAIDVFPAIISVAASAIWPLTQALWIFISFASRKARIFRTNPVQIRLFRLAVVWNTLVLSVWIGALLLVLV